MIAAVEDAQEGKPPESLPDGMKFVDLHTGLAHLLEKRTARRLAADGVVQESNVQSGPGPILEDLSNRPTNGIVMEDVRLEPDALTGRANVQNHPGNQGH